jgi:hypothetical protein
MLLAAAWYCIKIEYSPAVIVALFPSDEPVDVLSILKGSGTDYST